MKIILAKKKHRDSIGKIIAKAFGDPIKEAKKHARDKIKTKECFVAIENKEVVGVMI